MKAGGNGITPRVLWLLGWMVATAGLTHAQPSQTVSFSPASAIFSDLITVQLSGAAAGQQIRYEIARGPNAVSAEVTSNSPVYSGPVAVNTTSLIRAAVFPGEGGAGGRTTSGYYVKLHESLTDFRSQLPVLVLDTLGVGPLEKDNVNHASWLFGFAPDGQAPFPGAADFATPLVATVRGSSSAGFPKKGYNIRMRDEAGRSRAFPIFDLPAYERWAFVAPWAFDPTFINNALVYELSNRIGRWAPRTKLVEFFFNPNGDELDAGDYGGIYVVTDRIRVEPGRVGIDRLGSGDAAEPAITGGYVLKLNPPDPDEIGWVTSRGIPVEGPSQIVLDQPSADDVTPAQLSYIKGYVQQMEDALFADRATGFAQRTHLNYLDRSSWVDHHILNVLVNNPDALHRSAYFTKPRGGRLQAGPVWDFDRAVGGYSDDRTAIVDTWSGVDGVVDVWKTGWWGVLAHDPEFIQEWIDRWQTLRQAEFSNRALTTLAQNLADTIGQDAAQRDVERWPDSTSPFGSYPAQIEYLKNWLVERAQWIDAQFVAPPIIRTEGGQVTWVPPPGMLLAYAGDGADPRAVGGGFSPGTELHAGPLTVPPGTNLRVRSYDPVPQSQFPSSAWSTVTESTHVALSTVQGRIINFSSKANLTGGGASLIIGFVVSESDGKRYLIRAVGPGLDAFGEPATVDDPQLVVTSAPGAILARNDDWQTGAAAAQLPALTASLGAFPLVAGSNDAAAIVEAPSGSFTVQLTSAAGQSAGFVLGELYETSTSGRTANVSVRGRATVEQPLTGGFVIAGGTNRILIRAVGPTLSEFGVPDALADPTLTVRAGGAIIATNRTWLAGANAPMVEEGAARVGAFPLAAGSQDAALVATLPAGSYTVEVKPLGAAGTVLLEIYDLP